MFTVRNKQGRASSQWIVVMLVNSDDIAFKYPEMQIVFLVNFTK